MLVRIWILLRSRKQSQFKHTSDIEKFLWGETVQVLNITIRCKKDASTQKLRRSRQESESSSSTALTLSFFTFFLLRILLYILKEMVRSRFSNKTYTCYKISEFIKVSILRSIKYYITNLYKLIVSTDISVHTTNGLETSTFWKYTSVWEIYGWS